MAHLGLWDGVVYFRNANDGKCWAYTLETGALTDLPDTHNSRWSFVHQGTLYRSGTTLAAWRTIYAQDLQTGEAAVLCQDVSQRNWAVCPTGSGVYYVHDGDGSLWFAGYDGEAAQCVVGAVQSPVWDGQNVVYYLQNGGVYALDAQEPLFSGADGLFAADAAHIWYLQDDQLMVWSLAGQSAAPVTGQAGGGVETVCYQRAGTFYYYQPLDDPNGVVVGKDAA